MARNVEVKIRVANLDGLAARLEALGARDRGARRHVDTYFAAPEGLQTRLKLREQAPGPSELIAYVRPDTPDLRTSTYRRWPAGDPAAVRRALALALGVRGQVVKTRRLHVLGRTRFHLDRVEGLGQFVEVEVVLGRDEDPAAGEREAERILAALGLAGAPRIAGSYADLAP